MSRVPTLFACSVTLLAVFATVPPADPPEHNQVAAAKTQKGKIKRPHRVPVTPGRPLILYLHTDDLAMGDTVDTSDVTATYPHYTLTCTATQVVPDTASTQILLKVTFSVTRMLKAGDKRKPDDDKDYGTGDLTITLNSNDDGMTQVTAIPVYGE
jgi:hypothetical protein